MNAFIFMRSQGDDSRVYTGQYRTVGHHGETKMMIKQRRILTFYIYIQFFAAGYNVI